MPLQPFKNVDGAPVPFNPPSKVGTFDVTTCFATNGEAQTLTATGYLGNGLQLDVGPGLFEGYWIIDFTARKQSTGDESYTFYLLGSNDPNFANGNVEILDAQNFGGARSIAAIPGASPALPVPVTGSGEVNYDPVLNMKSGIVYRYIRCYLVVAGTAPSVTVNSWLTYDAC